MLLDCVIYCAFYSILFRRAVFFGHSVYTVKILYQCDWFQWFQGLVSLGTVCTVWQCSCFVRFLSMSVSLHVSVCVCVLAHRHNRGQLPLETPNVRGPELKSEDISRSSLFGPRFHMNYGANNRSNHCPRFGVSVHLCVYAGTVCIACVCTLQLVT